MSVMVKQLISGMKTRQASTYIVYPSFRQRKISESIADDLADTDAIPQSLSCSPVDFVVDQEMIVLISMPKRMLN